jgi:hypothetical protein
MAKDHYVAQTYLKSFSIANKEGFVNVVRKNNLQRLNEIPVKSICYKIDWNSNEYFSENPRLVEDFLKQFEPKWNDCVQRVSDDTYNTITKYLISGYLAYLRACTPTAMRLGASGLSNILQDLYEEIEAKEFANPDSKYRDVIETIRKHGGTKVSIKEAFPKAMGINALMGIQKIFATSPWIVFKNETPVQFLTSDNPVCLQYWNAGRCDMYCPITPSLAIIIHPLHDTEPREADSVGSLKPKSVEMFNQLMIQSAEDKVIFKEYSGIDKLVKEHQDWRVELQTLKIPTAKGKLTIQQQRPVKRTAYNVELYK